MPPANRNRVIVHAVIEGGMSAADAARRFGVTRQWVSVLVRRYRADGEAGLEPRSRRPRSSPTATNEATRARILHLRDTLTGSGLDAGAESIHARLARERPDPPSVSTIWRILKVADAIVPQPQKRPRSSIIRFEAAQPNETWQSDFTHLRLADGTDMEVISWLDDHSRYLLHVTAHTRVTGRIVTATFTETADQHGLPASTLTDNGMVYTTRFARGGSGPNGFEHLLARLGIVQKNGSPSHPQTQGKIERFHQTLKRWIQGQPDATTIDELNTQLARFRHIYNENDPTGRCTAAHRPRRTTHFRRQNPDSATATNIGESATTPSTTVAPSPSATPADSDTSASAEPTKAPPSCS